MKNNNQYVLLRRIAGTVYLLAILACFMGITVCASENTADIPQAAAIVSSRTTDEGIYVYIKGVRDIKSGTTVQVGNTLCDDIQVAVAVSMGIPIRTTILFDNSQSLSKKWGSQAKELATGLIDNHVEGEEFRIATFADGLNLVADFSSEYDSLKVAVDGIEFLDQKSYLTDILYDLLKQSGDSGEANYTRLIIITDGADDQDIKYTQTELSDLMKSSGVVIHTVGVKTSKNNYLLENLFSYARLTGGTYKTVEANADVEDIRKMIDEDYLILCLKLIPKTDIMDGSRKEAKLTLNTSDGTVVLTASLQMPFADASSIQPESVDSGASTDPDPAGEKSELPSIVMEPQAGEETSEPGKPGISILPVIIIGAVVLVIIFTLAVLLVMKGRNKKQVDVVIANSEQSGDGTQKGGTQVSVMQQREPMQSGGNTVRLGGQVKADTAGKTVCLQGGIGQNAVRQTFITLTDISNPQRNFRVPIDTRIVIGRATGDIILGHDAAVSHTHCEIIKKGNLFYINDLKSSNGTFYGSIRVCHETPVMNGGILEVGTCKYKITIEN